MAIPDINVLGNPNVTEGNFQIAIEDLRKSVIGSGKAYDSANTYSQYDTCIYGGVEYYSRIDSNTGNTPIVGVNWGDMADLIASVVHLTGNETIAGIKTFTSNIDGNITGNSATATKLQTARTINGVAFDGTANISVGLESQYGLLTSSFTLNDTYKNRLLVCSGTFNITLPTVNTIKSGSLFIIDNNTGTGTLSLVTNGNNTDLSRLTVLAGEVLILQSDGGSFYRFVSRSKDFASNTNVTAGYTYLPNGVIMQWGRSLANIAPGGNLNITFPISFPNDTFYADVAILSASTNNSLSTPFVIASSPTNLTIDNNDVDSSITQIRWFAIGF